MEEPVDCDKCNGICEFADVNKCKNCGKIFCGSCVGVDEEECVYCTKSLKYRASMQEENSNSSSKESVPCTDEKPTQSLSSNNDTDLICDSCGLGCDELNKKFSICCSCRLKKILQPVDPKIGKVKGCPKCESR